MRTVREKDRQTCCRRYHVETRSVFKSCMDFRRNLFEKNCPEEQGQIKLFENLTDLYESTLFENSQDRLNCINRNCGQCGVDRLQVLLEEKDATAYVSEVPWEKCQYMSLDLKKDRYIKKLRLVKQCSTQGEMFVHFINPLKTYLAHQHRATWQPTI